MSDYLTAVGDALLMYIVAVDGLVTINSCPDQGNQKANVEQTSHIRDYRCL